MQKLVTKPTSFTICPLYRIVFDSRYVKTAVFVLLASMFVQPVSLAYASEEAAQPTPQLVAEVVSEPEPEPVAEEIVATNSISEEEIVEANIPADNLEEDTPATTAEIEDEMVEEEYDDEVADTQLEAIAVASSTQSATTSSDETPKVTDTEPSATSTETVVVEDDGSGESGSGAAAVSEDEEEIDEVTTAGSSTPPLVAVVENNSNFHQFSKDDCVAVGDGSFYCGATSAEAGVVQADSFYTALDLDGDQEIFARIDGEVTQITNNTLDDAAPYYDGISETVVWHRAINERYQIVSYDIKSGKETILTSDRVNNMQPTRHGDITVWQQWGDNSWEIIMLEDGTKTQLTNDVYHDIAPSIRGEYVLWKTTQADTQVVSVYNIATGDIEIIHDSEVGMSVSNPRMVLVYDGLTAAGDRVTRGYDPATGAIIPLSTEPRDMPDTIPDSEPVKETRALIQTKNPAGRDESDQQDTDDVVLGVASSTATTTDNISDLDLSATDVNPATTTVETIPDVIVPPVATTTSMEEESSLEIEEFDLVIPPTSTSSKA